MMTTAPTTPPTMPPVLSGADEELEPDAARRPKRDKSGDGEGELEGVGVGHVLAVANMGKRACPL